MFFCGSSGSYGANRASASSLGAESPRPVWCSAAQNLPPRCMDGRGPQPCLRRGVLLSLVRRGAPLMRPAGPGNPLAPAPLLPGAGRCPALAWRGALPGCCLARGAARLLLGAGRCPAYASLGSHRFAGLGEPRPSSGRAGRARKVAAFSRRLCYQCKRRAPRDGWPNLHIPASAHQRMLILR